MPLFIDNFFLNFFDSSFYFTNWSLHNLFLFHSFFYFTYVPSNKFSTTFKQLEEKILSISICYSHVCFSGIFVFYSFSPNSWNYFFIIPVIVCFEGRFGFLSLQPNPAFTTTLHCSVARLSRQLAALAFRKHRQQ